MVTIYRKKQNVKTNLMCQPIISSIQLSIQAITELIKNIKHTSACIIRLVKENTTLLLLYASAVQTDIVSDLQKFII